jgi:hypothetical protein
MVFALLGPRRMHSSIRNDYVELEYADTIAISRWLTSLASETRNLIMPTLETRVKH